MSSSNIHWKRTYTVILGGQAFSLLGSSAAQFAILWWLVLTTRSATVLATASIAGFLPQALIGPFAGVLVDRIPRKRVMIVADLAIAAAAGLLALAFLGGPPPIFLVYVVLFLRSVGTSFHVPAMQAAVPMLVPEEELVRAGGWGQALQSLSLMLGPALGALAMEWFSMTGVLLMDVIGALAAVVTLSLVHIPDPEASGTTGLGVLRDIGAAGRELVGNRPLMRVTLPVLVTVLAYLPVGALFPLMVLGHFGGSAWHASAVEFTFAGGMTLASIVMGIWGGLKNRYLMIHLSLGCLGAAITVAGLLPGSAFWGFVILSGIMGAAGSIFSVPYFALVQAGIRPEALGRVFALLGAVMTLAAPLGLVAAGPGARFLGVDGWFLGSGLVILTAVILGHLMTRGLRDQPTTNPAPEVTPP